MSLKDTRDWLQNKAQTCGEDEQDWYAFAVSACDELAWRRRQLEFAKHKFESLEEYTDDELSFDRVVFEGYGDDGIPVCERGEIQAWARETLKELEVIE